MEAQPRDVQIYQTEYEHKPYQEWLDGLKDKKGVAAIDAKIAKVRRGNLGDCAAVGQGVCEFRIDCGPGYRVYFGQVGQTIVILLCGGDKSTQDADIEKAKGYWKGYKERKKL